MLLTPRLSATNTNCFRGGAISEWVVIVRGGGIKARTLSYCGFCTANLIIKNNAIYYALNTIELLSKFMSGAVLLPYCISHVRIYVFVKFPF